MKVFFSALLGSLAAFLLLLGGFFLLVIMAIVAFKPAPVTVPKKSMLVMHLSRPISDSSQDDMSNAWLRQMLRSDENDDISLRLLVNALAKAEKDDQIVGLFLTGNVQSTGTASGPAALKELREAIQGFKTRSHKPVISYNQLYSKKDFYLTAGANKVYLDPSGTFDLTGFATETTFFGNAFKKYGIDAQITRVGKYKSAVEPFISDKMSEASREQTRAYIEDVWDDWKTTVAADRKLTPDFLQTLSDEKGLVMAEEAQTAKLVDKLTPYHEVLDELKALTGKAATAKDFSQVDMETYLKDMTDTAKGASRIAVVYAEGDIVDGEGRDSQVGGSKLSRQLRELRLDSDVKAIVLRVNSPGGSASASEVIAQELRMAKEAGKPVVVSMGHLAASGGYWISMDANRIFAQPNTLTGSIGVFGLQANLKKLAADHGITWDGVQTSKVGPPSLSRPRTAKELERVQFMVDTIYDTFVSRVASGRKLAKEQVAEIAQGRIWSGKQALKLGLVDELGGLQAAIQCAARLANVEGHFQVDPPALPKNFFEKLLSTFEKSSQQPRSHLSPLILAKQKLESYVDTLSAFNDPKGVYLRMPATLSME